MLHCLDSIVEAITGYKKKKNIAKGTVVLMKKNFLDFNDFNAAILDDFQELLGKRVSFQLITSVKDGGPENGESEAKVGKPSYLDQWITTNKSTAEALKFNVTFEWDVGVPVAVIVRNEHLSEFYLRTLTLENVPDGHGRVHFVCNSWVYPSNHYQKDRVFFTNKAYLPHETPWTLRKYREEELANLRGDGEGKLQEWDRVYDYAFYNDLANPDKGPDYARPVLGGSNQYPYPRRGRTGRPPSNSDPNTESRLPLLSSLKIYVPRDERFGHIKMSDFLASAIKSVSQMIQPTLEGVLHCTPCEFVSFDDELKIYEGGIKLFDNPVLKKIQEIIPLEFLKQVLPTEGEGILKYPMPSVIKKDKFAWRTDEEFAREMLAGVNPVLIRRLEEFPPKSHLSREQYGNQDSSITAEHIKNNLDGMSVEQAIANRSLFILDHHDTVMPYLTKINTSTASKAYASRTILFLKDDDTLKPLAIELSLPHPNGQELGAISKVYTPAISKVYTPAEVDVEASIWQLAKAYVAVNDSGHHQLVSHWMNTHAAIEPFVIATNRQLSVLHPIYKLLHPHFRNTMYINAIARQILLNAGGILESTVYPAKYSMEMSSLIYKSWVFPEQALPEDLKKRGMAVDDPESRHGIRLVIMDYPYAVDGLEVWFAIKEWVEEYCYFYYKGDEMVQQDTELQSWWKEVREEGHGDLKDEPWWPKMQTLKELVECCTIIIWTASALHAAVNFGQFPYAGYHPNRPTTSRRFMPEKGTPEFEELVLDADRAYLKTITARLQSLLGISLIEILSRHASDEVYLGQTDTPEWTTDEQPLEAFKKFGKKLAVIEDRMFEMN